MDVIKHIIHLFLSIFFNSSAILPSTAKQLFYTIFYSYFTLEDVTAPMQSFTFLCLKTIYTFTTPTIYPCVFTSLLSSPTLNAHPTSHTHSYTAHSPPLHHHVAPLLCCPSTRCHCTIPLQHRYDFALLEPLRSSTSSCCFYMPFFSSYEPLKLEPLNSLCFKYMCA